MGAVVYRAAAELRRSIRGALGIAALVALFGGLVLGAVAGARRTASAYPRMLERTGAPELLVSPPGAPGADPTPFYEELEQLDGVQRVGVISGMGYLPLAGSPTATAAARISEVSDLGVMLGSLDGETVFEMRRPVVSEGRLPAPDALDEIFVTRNAARRTGFAVGDVLDLVLVSGDLFGFATEATADQGTVLHLEVVGTGTLANEVIAYNDLDQIGMLLPSPAVAALQERADWGFEGAFVDLEAKADVERVAAQIRALGDRPELGTGGPVFVSDETAQAARVQDGLRPIAVALVAFAAAVAVVALVVVGQALARHTRPSAGDLLALRAMGVGAGQRALVPLARALAVATVGAVGAVGVAIALSPRFPIGPARIAETSPGIRVDAPVLVLGALALVGLTVAVLVPAAIVRARRAHRTPRALGRAVTSVAGSAGLPAPAVQGIRLAFGTGSDGSAPARSAVVVAVFAVAAVLGSAGFAHGLADLVDHPARYGQGWDRLLDASFAPVPARMFVDELRGDPNVAGLAVGNYGELSVDGVSVPAVELATVTGDVGITVIDGARADEPGEIVLGGEVLEELGAGVGDEVQVDAGDGHPATYEVVGQAVFPRLGRGSFDGTGLGIGAQVAPGPLPIPGAREMIAEEGFDVGDFAVDGHFFAFVAVDVAGAPGALDDRFGELVRAGDFYVELRAEIPPTTIRDLDRVRDVPATLAVVLALVAVAALGHQLGSSVRERRYDLALLRTLGFSGRQLRLTVLGQGALLALVAVLVGVPLGLATGRIVWRAFADALFVDAASPTPWTWVAGAAPVAVMVACALAAVPAARTSRLRAAAALREEA